MNALNEAVLPDYFVSQKARQDLNEIYTSRAVQDAQGAKHVIGDLLDAFSSLMTLPHIGWPWVGNMSVNVFPFQDYLIFYTIDVKRETVSIERVIDRPRESKKIKGVVK